MTRTSPAAERPSVAADEGTLRALEFGAIVEQLAELTSFEPARELALASVPSPDTAHVALLQDQTDEAGRLLDDQAQASIGGARDIRGSLDRAARGGRLTPADLLEVADTLEATARFEERLRSWTEPHLAGLREDLDAAPELAARIVRSVDESGEILDSASSELATIRRRLRTSQDRVRERLNTMLRSTQLAGVIGEPIVTVRSGRYVIPIRAEAKGKVKGIVHDQSASGATLFIEPLTVVELNNAWTEASLAAAREEERILDELSAEVEARSDALRDSLSALARADLWMARARLGSRMDAVRPAPADDAAELLSARHPLLGAAAVPIDLRLGDRFGYRALVVTGPNTGGKTVSLKTLGLLALMNQAGLRVPAAEGARLPVFRRVMADIGDEQSIAQSLSTFSSHLRNVVSFVEAAGTGDAGPARRGGSGHRSDRGLGPRHGGRHAAPRCGSHGCRDDPLRRAEDVRDRTSVGHECRGGVRRRDAAADLSALDRPAGEEPGIRDRGAAGPAQRDPGRCSRADLEGARQHGGDAGRDLTSTGGAAGCPRRRHRRSGAQRPMNASVLVRGVARARQEAGALLADARRAADDMLARAEREVVDVRRELTRQRNLGGRRAPRGAEAFDDLATKARRVRSETAAAPGVSVPEADEQEGGEPDGPQPRVGLWARSRTLGSTGRILEISGRTGRVTLETDGARLVIPADDLDVVPEPITGPAPRDLEAEEMRRRAAERVSPTLDLHGERVEAALERLHAYLDDALLAGLDSVVDRARHRDRGAATRRARGAGRASARPRRARWPP